MADSNSQSSNDFQPTIALPKTYNGKTVTELFPEFKHNSVLRFSKLFGPGRPTSLPKIWKGVKKRNKKAIENQISIKEETNKPEEENLSTEQQTQIEKNDNNQPSQLDLDFGLIEAPQIEHQQDKQLNELNTPKEYIEDELGFKINYGREARDDECLPDDYLSLLKPYIIDNEVRTPTVSNSRESSRKKLSSWRYGPASYWYDKFDVPLDAKDYDYGFKKKVIKPQEDLDVTQETFALDLDLSEATSQVETYLLLNTLDWEQKIIYDPQKEKIDLNSERIKYAGWVPTNEHRTLSSFQSKVFGRNLDFLTHEDVKVPAKWSSLFPNENYELLYGNWEKNIIMDPTNMEVNLTPQEFVLDVNDDNLIFSVPDEPQSELKDENKEDTLGEGKETDRRRRKNELNESRVKISKLNKNKDELQNEEKEETTLNQPREREPKDFFNISNDDYYNPKISVETTQVKTTSSLVLQHSTVAVDLKPQYFPTHLSKHVLRHFHRLPIKNYQSGILSSLSYYPIESLTLRIKEKAIVREQERAATGGGDFFCMRNASDLSGMDDDLIFAEYSEQFPPLIMQIGMATKIKNYFKRKPGKDEAAPQYDYGENVHAHQSPFLGALAPGESLQAFENYMFRAPIYYHKMPQTDYLVIRTRQGYYIREVKDIFVVGQECPLVEVPGPNSKRANNFIKDFLQVVMFRLFHKSQENPKRIKMDDIRRAFPSLLENSIRKRLKIVADFKKSGTSKSSSGDYWILRENVRLPSEEDLKQLVSPEACCAYYSMLAAEQRLKDAGYGEKNLFLDENEDVDNMKLDDEIKNAPWHTTRAYLDAVKGKCLLQVNGPADPTGRGEGFSYVRQAIKNTDKENKKEKEKEQEEEAKQDKSQAKKMVTGTDADLRRLHLKDAKKLLLEYGLPENEIRMLKRWEIIDVVRTMSTQKAKEGQSAMAKFARGTKQTQSDAHEKFREECQRIFELQNRSLASEEVFSSDEEDDSNEDSDADEMGKNLESLLQTKKSGPNENNPQNQQQNELKKLLFAKNIDTEKSSDEKLDKKHDDNKSRILKITRTYKDEETGKETTNVEIIKDPLIIDAYVKIRSTKDDNFIRQAFALDESEKEQLRKERRRLQEQLRRVKRSEAARQKTDDPNAEPKPKKKYNKRQTIDPANLDESGLNTSTGPKEPVKTVKCGACGTIGHSRTNRECPMYVPKDKDKDKDQHNISSAYDDDSHDPSSQTGFTKIQGTKLIIAKRAIPQKSINEDSQSEKQPGENEKLVLTIPKQKLNKQAKTIKQPKLPKIKPPLPPGVNQSQTQLTGEQPNAQSPTILQAQISRESSKGQKRKSTSQSLDYLEKPQKKVDRRHVDPLVSLASLLEQVLNELRDLPDSQPFLIPVNAKKVPDYYNLIENPIDLQTIRKRIHDKYYKNQATFVDEIKLLVKNSSLYNGNHHIITAQAQNLLGYCMSRLNERKEQISRAEKAINPLLDDNSLNGFNYLLENIFEKNVMTVENSYSFQKPVSKIKYKDYYDIIKNPIDLETIRQKISFKKYKSKKQFLSDFELMFNNCLTYNGPTNSYTQTAQKILDQCKLGIEQNFDQLDQFEQSIQLMSNQGIRQSIDAPITSDNESNVITVSSQHDNESRDSHRMDEAPLNLTNKRLKNVFFSSKQNQSPQSSVIQSDQEFVDIEGLDDNQKINIADDLNISEEDDD